MLLWYWYLIAVSALSFAGYITPELFPTLALAAAAHLLSRFPVSKSPRHDVLKTAAVAAAALALLWRLSYLPPPGTVLAMAEKTAMRPSPRFVLEFLEQSLDPLMLAGGAVLFAAALYLGRKRPRALAAAAYLIFFSAWLALPGQKTAPEGTRLAEAFYEGERGKAVKFSRPESGSPAFDLVILHICSLSWQDMRDAGFDSSPFFSKFDYVLTGFNSASTYSGDSAIRLLKSPCGQLPPSRLYSDSPDGCYLMEELRRSGFRTYTMLSHNGAYGGFSGTLQKYGRADAPIGVDDLPPVYRMFDGTVLHADSAALLKFWELRERSGEPRAALYYNTANLHIGTHRPGAPRRPEDADSYRQRLAEMTEDMEEFFAAIERSGRKAVVIFAGEHGAALSGTRMQPKGVREIPLPRIALVPAAVKVIGGRRGGAGAKPLTISKPAGGMALAWLIAELLRRSPYDRNARSAETVAAELPGTGFMADNGAAAVMENGGGYLFRLNWKGGGKWFRMPERSGMRP